MYQLLLQVGIFAIPATTLFAQITDPWPCNRDFSTHSVWQNQFFYSQAVYTEIKQKERVQSVLKEQLKLNHHRGFNIGHCSERSHWYILSYPSAISMEPKEEFNESDIKKHCRAYRIDFIGDHDAKSRSYHSDDREIDGVRALTCYPKDRDEPEEWILEPTGTKLKSLPYSTSTSMKDFIASVRNRYKLNPIKFTPFTTHAGLSHSRHELRKVRSLLEGKGLHLIGENRVKTQSLKEAFFLLWYSPRHRDLLLDPKARGGIIAEQTHRKEQLFSIVLFH
jgi:hypothetical protein